MPEAPTTTAAVSRDATGLPLETEDPSAELYRLCRTATGLWLSTFMFPICVLFFRAKYLRLIRSCNQFRPFGSSDNPKRCALHPSVVLKGLRWWWSLNERPFRPSPARALKIVEIEQNPLQA